MLPYAEPIFARIEASEQSITHALHVTVFLTDQRFDFFIADEQAKANVNALLEHHTVSNVEDRMRDALSGSGLANQIRLRPAFDDDNDAASTQPAALSRAIRTFGQIVTDASAPQKLSGVSGRSPTEVVTCWGDGAINVMRADEPALRLALWPTLSRVQIGRIVTARDQLLQISRQNPANALDIDKPQDATPGVPTGVSQGPSQASSMAYLLKQAEIDPKVAAGLTVTDHSTCHSLWIVTKDRQRVWYTFSVADDSRPQHPFRDSFSW